MNPAKLLVLVIRFSRKLVNSVRAEKTPRAWNVPLSTRRLATAQTIATKRTGFASRRPNVLELNAREARVTRLLEKSALVEPTESSVYPTPIPTATVLMDSTLKMTNV